MFEKTDELLIGKMLQMNEQNQKLLNDILKQLKAIELQIVIGRYKNDICSICDNKDTVVSQETEKVMLDRLKFIVESDEDMFLRRYSVFKSNEDIIRKLDQVNQLNKLMEALNSDFENKKDDSLKEVKKNNESDSATDSSIVF